MILYYYISILTEFIMSCHYSCATCSTNVYMFSCLSCPPTRDLIGSTCICSSGYYQGQQSACYPSEQASTLTQLVLPLADILYYTNIGLFWLYIIIMFCRVNSPKIRILINFAQMIALIKNYPAILDQISKQFIWSLSAYNYQYYLSLFSCTDGTAICTLFEYLWQPLLVFPSMVLCFLFSYVVINACYRTTLQDSITFINYCKCSWAIIVYTFIDYTAVILSYNLTKAALLSYWGFIFVGLYMVGIIVMVVYYFRIINSKQQSKVLYRGKYSWAYGYDQNYHMYFIDYLYQQARYKSYKQNQNKTTAPVQMQQQIGNNNNNNNNTNNNGNDNDNNKEQQIRMFVPHSNLYMLQLFVKLMVGCTTVVLYEYKPTIIVYPLIILLNIGLCWLGAFFYYDKFTLLLYWLMSIILLFSITFYWFSIYWFATIAIGFVIPALVFAVFVVLFFYNRKINPKLISRMFMQQSSSNTMSRNNIQQLSQQEMKIQRQPPNNNNSDGINNNDAINSGQQVKKDRKQPFVGNLTRKVIQKNRTNNIIQSNVQQQDLLRTKTNSKSKTIFKDMVKQQHQGQASENIIRHSQFQKKISNNKTKMTARNRTKNAFVNLAPIQQNNAVKSRQDDQNNQQQSNAYNEYNEVRRQGSKQVLLSNKTRQIFTKTNKDNESNLQNLLKQPTQQSQINRQTRRTNRSKQKQLI